METRSIIRLQIRSLALCTQAAGEVGEAIETGAFENVLDRHLEHVKSLLQNR